MQKEKRFIKDGKKGNWILLLVLFLFSIISCVLGVLCLGNAQNQFLQKHFILLSAFFCGILCGLCGLAVWFTFQGRELFLKSIFSLYLLIVFFCGLCLILQKTGFFQVVTSTESLQTYLEETGVWMPFFYVALQFLQVVILPIPSVVSTVAGVALFGAFKATLYSVVGILSGSFLAFIIGRKLGDKAVSWLIGEGTLRKWQKKMKHKDKLFLTAMFILPVFPDDVLCFVAGLSSMSTSYFIVMVSLSRVAGIAATCYSIDFIPFNTWWGILIWILYALALVFLFVWIYKNMDKWQCKHKRNVK